MPAYPSAYLNAAAISLAEVKNITINMSMHTGTRHDHAYRNTT